MTFFQRVTTLPTVNAELNEKGCSGEAPYLGVVKQQEGVKGDAFSGKDGTSNAVAELG